MKTTLAIIALLVVLIGCTQPASPPNGASDTNSNQNGGNNLSTTVETGDTITVNYRGTLSDGTEFDSSLKPGRTPLEFTVGAGQMIAGFDEAVVGMKLNEEKTVTLAPDKAYGETRPDLIVKIPLEQLAEIPANQLVVGAKLAAGNGMQGTITAISDTDATINFNHELAGKTLMFWIKIVTIDKK